MTAPAEGFSLFKNHPAFAKFTEAEQCAEAADIATNTVIAGVERLKSGARIFYQDFSSLGNLFLDETLKKVTFIDFGIVDSSENAVKVSSLPSLSFPSF